MADSGNHQKEQREQTESRKRKAGEALGEGTSQGAGPSGSGGGAKSKNLPFNPEASSAAVMASASLEGRMRMLDACSASASARPDVTEPQQPEIGPSQMVQGPQGSQEPPCLPRGPGDFLGDAMGNEIFNCRSSQISAKSEKNMADFDGEESGCEEELVQINSHAELSSHLQQHLPNLASIYHEHWCKFSNSHAVTDINLDNVCKKGNTLLWDLVQDDDAIHLSEGLINEAEKLLCSLVCWFTDRQIRMRFIEGCLDNLAHH
ncbi:hypothetical protein KUCAC02_026767, partial [Chaenocephalus aceratus]